MKARPLVAHIEDDPTQQLLVSAVLSNAGYQVQSFPTAEAFCRHLRVGSVDLAILDWMLPDMSGLQLLEWIRNSSQPKLPVILLTGKETQEDIVAGFDAGADDYIVKPLQPRQLQARVQAVLRRSGFETDEMSLGEFAPYEIDLQGRSVRLNGQAIKLTDREFDLLMYLFRRRGNIVTRETLLRQIWNMPVGVSSRTVDTHISRLRKKMQLEGANGWRLSGVFQHGYRLERLQNLELATPA